MRANTRFAWSAVGVALMASVARALPQPPYAIAQDGASTPAASLDRYGGRVSETPLPASLGETTAPASSRLLSWPGKVAAAGSPPAPQQPVGVRAAVLPSTPSNGWRPPSAAETPATIYDTPAKTPPVAIASAATVPGTPLPGPPNAALRRQVEGGPRFYSVHRDYGIQPDAIPLAPQFFGPTADLSAPPSDVLVKRVTSASGQTRTVEVASGDQTNP